MTTLERELRAFVLLALLQADGSPITDDALKAGARMRFSHVAFTAADLEGHVRGCEGEGWISGTQDELLGRVWALTPKGKIRAQQLVK